MHLVGNQWRVIVAGFFLCVVMSFVRGLMRRRGAAWFDVVLAILMVGLLAYVVLHVRR